VAVKNTGRGIPPEQIDKVFERFYRMDASRTQENGGCGLGLAIAKSIVQSIMVGSGQTAVLRKIQLSL
jgi:two-component system sensor histidine kinase CiaH